MCLYMYMHVSVQVGRPSIPSTQQHQVLNRVTPALPPSSQKPFVVQHSTTSPSSSHHYVNSANTAGGESTNTESSDSEGYEDVISGNEEDITLRNPWTTRKKTPPRVVPFSDFVTKVYTCACMQL